jgi:hypothetical protein
MDNQETKPDRDILFGIASSQEGYFTTRQAADAGYSTQLLFKHIRAGRVVQTRRGIYRPLTSIPPHLRGIEVRGKGSRSRHPTFALQNSSKPLDNLQVPVGAIENIF